jgi:hypothetical protein
MTVGLSNFREPRISANPLKKRKFAKGSMSRCPRPMGMPSQSFVIAACQLGSAGPVSTPVGAWSPVLVCRTSGLKCAKLDSQRLQLFKQCFLFFGRQLCAEFVTATTVAGVPVAAVGRAASTGHSHFGGPICLTKPSLSVTTSAGFGSGDYRAGEGLERRVVAQEAFHRRIEVE